MRSEKWKIPFYSILSRQTHELNTEQKANHIVSTADNNGFCVGEVLADEKPNEITAIPELLKSLNIKGHIAG